MRISSKLFYEAKSQLATNDETSRNELFAKLGARKCFRDADANKDGVITQDEVSLSEEAFARLDASKDGKVTQEEISSAMAGRGKEVFSYYTSKRKAAKSQELLAAMLTQPSGQNEGAAAEKAARQYVTRLDANKDGVLSRKETSISATAFTNLDTSGNGSLELEEVQAALTGHDAKLSSYYASLQDSAAQSTLRKKV